VKKVAPFLENQPRLALQKKSGKANQIGLIQGLCYIFHLTLDQLGTTGMADPRSAAEGGAEAPILLN